MKLAESSHDSEKTQARLLQAPTANRAFLACLRAHRGSGTWGTPHSRGAAGQEPSMEMSANFGENFELAGQNADLLHSILCPPQPIRGAHSALEAAISRLGLAGITYGKAYISATDVSPHLLMQAGRCVKVGHARGSEHKGRFQVQSRYCFPLGIST